jgi:hypothetical protein
VGEGEANDVARHQRGDVDRRVRRAAANFHPEAPPFGWCRRMLSRG